VDPLSQLISESLALDVFHGNKILTVAGLRDFMNIADMGMVNRCGRLGFTQKSLVGYGISLKTRRQELQSNLTLQRGIFSQADFSHSTFANFLQFTVVRYRLPIHEEPPC